MALGLLLLVASTLSAQPSSDTLNTYLLRVAEEADTFARLAPKVIGLETLEQVALQNPPRYRLRGAQPQLPFKTRNIVSEYGFSTFQDDQNLHEVRHVLNVDGKQVKEKGKLRETLSMDLKAESDRVKKRMVKEFESYGLRQSATDFGQLLLLFARSRQQDYDFAPLREQFIGTVRCAVLSFQQRSGDTAALTVFEGKRVLRHPLKGELYLRHSDGLPLRITLDASRAEGGVTLQHHAVVDYQMSPHGVLLPAAVNYAESAAGRVFVENRFQYSTFRMFGASSEVRFTVEELQPDPPSKNK